MRNKELLKLLAGFRRFRERYFTGEASVYTRLSVNGQTPKTLIIACSDSRVDPAIISGASPGELFVVRNVANLVPPCEENGQFHGVSSAIEFAVVNLKVENIIVLGHRQCGGIRHLMFSPGLEGESFVGKWVQIAQEAKERVQAVFAGADEETQCRACELEAIKVSLKNLKTFPFVRKALAEGRLEMHGIYFDLESGELLELSRESTQFHQIEL